MSLFRSIASLLSWKQLCFGLRFHENSKCREPAYLYDPASHTGICDPCGGECDGVTCFSEVLGIDIPVFLRVNVWGGLPTYEYDRHTGTCLVDGWHPTYTFGAFKDYNEAADGVYIIRLRQDSGGIVRWAVEVCNVDVEYTITVVTIAQRCVSGTPAIVDGVWYYCRLTINGHNMSGVGPNNTAEMLDAPTWEHTFGVNETLYYYNPADPYGCPGTKFYSAGIESFRCYPDYDPSSALWFGVCPPDPDLCPLITLTASISAATFNEQQLCCSHGHYCPDQLIAKSYCIAPADPCDNRIVDGCSEGVDECLDELIDGMCCAKVTISQVKMPEGLPECYFGFAPAGFATTDGYVTFESPFKHRACGTWTGLRQSCASPYPSKLTLTPEYQGYLPVPHGLMGNYVPDRWQLELTAYEYIVTAESSKLPEIRGVTFRGYSDYLSHYGHEYDGFFWTSQTRPWKALLDDIVLEPVDYTPNPQGVDYSDAKVTVEFGGTWDWCSEEADIPPLTIWGFRMIFLDPRGIENRLIYSPKGGSSFTNGLSPWQLVADVSRRNAVLISLQYSVERLGHVHGFCFDGHWPDYTADHWPHPKAPAQCRVAELIIDDMARLQYMQVGFLPGSVVSLEPLYEQPSIVADTSDPDEHPTGEDEPADMEEGNPKLQLGSICDVDTWLLTWNGHDVTLTLDDHDISEYLWLWETEYQTYRLIRKADGPNGEGNYTLTLDLVPPITAVATDDKKFTLAGDHRWEFAVGTTFIIHGSTGNDGSYTVAAVDLVGGDTVITVSEAIPDATADGNAQKNLTATITTGRATNCCYAPAFTKLGDTPGAITLGTGETATLFAGAEYLANRKTGCPSKCDAATWSMAVTGLAGPSGPESRSATLNYYPQLYSWWAFAGSPEEVFCVVRLADNPTTGASRYACYLTWNYDPYNVRHEHVIFEIADNGGDCCGAATVVATGSSGSTFTLTASC